jgi:hypothetical protein
MCGSEMFFKGSENPFFVLVSVRSLSICGNFMGMPTRVLKTRVIFAACLYVTL